MSTVQRLRITFADILFCLFVFIVSTSVLIAHDVGLIEFKNISFTPLACVTLFILTLSALLYLRNTYGRRFTPSCYQSFGHCVAQVRVSLLQQHNEFLANRLQKATNDLQEATANVKKEQSLSKFYREMVSGACTKYAELERASTEASRRSNDESKQNVVRLNALVNNLRQDLDLSQADVRRLAHSAKEHERDMEAADQNRLKAIAKARHTQAEADALRLEAVSALDAMSVEIDLFRRDLGASKRRAKAVRNEARASHAENVSLRSALAEYRKEVSRIQKGAKAALDTLMADLKEQKANNKNLDRLLAAYKGGVPVATSPPLTPPGSVTPPEDVKFSTNSVSAGRELNGTGRAPQQPNHVSNEGIVTSSNPRSLRRLLRPWGYA